LEENTFTCPKCGRIFYDSYSLECCISVHNKLRKKDAYILNRIFKIKKIQETFFNKVSEMKEFSSWQIRELLIWLKNEMNFEGSIHCASVSFEALDREKNEIKVSFDLEGNNFEYVGKNISTEKITDSFLKRNNIDMEEYDSAIYILKNIYWSGGKPSFASILRDFEPLESAHGSASNGNIRYRLYFRISSKEIYERILELSLLKEKEDIFKTERHKIREDYKKNVLPCRLLTNINHIMLKDEYEQLIKAIDELSDKKREVSAKMFEILKEISRKDYNEFYHPSDDFSFDEERLKELQSFFASSSVAINSKVIIR
jgi:hypothetical protein